MLFKYCPPEQLRILESKLIRFTQPSLFNDPFDCFPCFEPSSEVNPIGHKVFISEESHPIEAQSEAIQKHTTDSKSRDPAFNLDAVVQYHFPDEEAKKYFLEGFRAKPQESQDDKLVLCLSENRNNLLMWSHYAKQHSGFIIGFDSENPYFRFATPETHVPGYLHKVVYSSKRPKGIYRALSIQDAHLKKSDDWEDEKEWRILEIVKNATEVGLDEIGRPLYLFSYPPRCIKEIILGCRSSKETEDHVRNLRDSDASWSHLSLLKAVADEEQYKLNYIKIN